ncbi:phage holin family protein [Paenibacillus sp. LHD-117]|uniref:phage holin family protein n=1 Tax=Paenibacillus sp. LHD-117 TaxID=3071412 RepID=UPI0027E19CC3|nr:phage holin family protein [Paenibacillus sp. LHD-117]MDQ6421819.1 phage holin family protein [Paenibacillus sp. LHD-117]
MPLIWVCSACGVLGSILTFAFGGWSESLTFLLVAMGADYVTGVIASIKEGKGLSSSIGAWGLARKGLSILVVLLAHRIDILLGIEDMTMGAAIYFYIANELISVTENYGRLGLPLPERIRKMIAVLKEKDK